ncbi:MAG: rieske iron-sulfur protein [Gammaproteobacteria bacterium]|jgi:rieske iron-sulfur protein
MTKSPTHPTLPPAQGLPTNDDAIEAPISRRRLLQAAVAGGIGANLAPVMAKTINPRKQPAQAGDDIVFPSWENDGRAVCLQDIEVASTPILAYPRDPSTRVVRDKSRLNQILLVRFNDDEFSSETKEFTVSGVVAYSGVCTHTGCSVTEWDLDAKNFLCPCHASQFDPRDRARIVGGPALRPLPMLALAVEGEYLKVRAPFNARLGANKKK